VPLLIRICLRMAAKTDLAGHVRFFNLPGIAGLQPPVAQFFLPAIFDFLVKHAELIANTVSNGRNLQGGQRVQVTGRQPPEPPVAQARFLFMINDGLKIKTGLPGGLDHIVKKTQAN